VIALAVAASALALPASAAADAEPNNALWQAEGPIGGGADVLGTLTTADDADWYLFYAHPQQQLHLTSSTDRSHDYEDDDCVELRGPDGEPLTDDYTTPPGSARRYFVRVGHHCEGTSYRFRIDPVGAVTSGPVMPGLQRAGEPNELVDQASGPLVGGTTYTGTIETANDVEWFYFYTAAGTHQLDISSTGMSGCSVELRLGADEISPSQDYVSHITRTVYGAERHLLSVNEDTDSCVGSDWQFRIDPPEAVTSSPAGSQLPPPQVGNAPAVVSTECLNAKRAVRKYKRQVTKAVRKLRRAHGRSRKIWKHRLAVATKRMKKAQRRQRAVC
jgi:hypothetical protein